MNLFRRSDTKPPIINDYQISHALDRIGQLDTFETILDWYQSPLQYLILSVPTGVGKTALVASMARYARVMALVKTKVLQEAVYKGDYDFDLLKGKRNYPCHYSPDTHQADVCGIPDSIDGQERYEMCMGSGLCKYFVEYENFCNSFKASTTYAKFITDRQSYNLPNLFVFDEAHEVPETVIEQAGINLNVNKYRFLKDFGDLYDQPSLSFQDGIDLVRRMYGVAMLNAPKLKKTYPSTSEVIAHKRALISHRRFLKRLTGVGKLMINSDNEGINVWHYSTTEDGNISARPMTAAHHFRHVLDTGHHKTILMSATITPMVADMLGLNKREYMFYEAPQIYPVDMRPIYDLGQPGMDTKACQKNPSLWNIQAVRISNVLKLRPDVSSVILVTSKAKANALSSRLRNIGHDVFQPPVGSGTDLQLQAWERYRKPGAACVSYNFWEGVSLDLDHMLFIAGIKYPDLGSSFEMARAVRSWNEFYYRGGVNMAQASGRIQRGHLKDYLPIGNKQVFLAVGNYKRAANLAPGDFAERIVPWPG